MSARPSASARPAARRKFLRARKPEEKEIRRQAILAAARRMLDEVETSKLSLNELARRAGVSKPNVYRYFESREDVLLQVWLEELLDLERELQRTLGEARVGDLAAVADAIVAGFQARPKLCELTSIITSVLERNLSAAAVLRSKEVLAASTERIARGLHERLPALSVEDCGWLMSTAALYVVGIWPAVTLPAAVREVVARSPYGPMQPVFERDFRRFLGVLLAGLHRPVAPGS